MIPEGYCDVNIVQIPPLTPLMHAILDVVSQCLKITYKVSFSIDFET